MDKKGSNNVKFLTENWTKEIVPCTRVWPTARKVSMLSTANASGCWAYCPRPMEATPWKRRSNLSLTAYFQLVENALNGFWQVTFLRYNCVLPQISGRNFRFYCIFVQSFGHVQGVYLGFTAEG